ncbi:MAG: Lrp/AsnC family transcriptional regulator [Bdellovibrionales bacterium]|nr:Lrp/AsnC family transcriptional regulator [Bdellovibrionales bacterium]
MWILDLDGRISLTDLARRVKQSPQIVSFRYNRLRKRKIIGPSLTLLNLHHVGLLTFRVYFRLRQLTADIEDDLRKFLSQCPDVLWLGQLSGSWDYEVVFVFKDYVAFARVWKSIQAKFGKFYDRYNVSMTTVTYHFRRDYLVKSTRREFAPAKYGEATTPVVLSESEKQLMSLLSRDCRIPLVTLQRKLKLGYQKILSMIAELEAKGIIQAYRVPANLDLIGRLFVKALIKLHYEGPESERKLYEFCARYPFVTYLIDVIGSWQFEVECEVEDILELESMMREMRRTFPSLIQDYEVVRIDKELVLRYEATNKW